MNELESLTHEHQYGPWEERGTEMVFLTKFFIQARRCTLESCRWTDYARTQPATVLGLPAVQA